MCFFIFQAKAQFATWKFKDPIIRIHFGTGDVRDVNTVMAYNYQRVESYCPTDGHYTYTPYTSNCFRRDWLTLTEDHTAGDVDGNMLLVNSSHNKGAFFKTDLNGLKGSTTYEFSVWMMNVCRISDKCPYPLLPDISMQLKTPSGKSIAQFATGEVPRRHTPGWKLYRAIFTTPSKETSLTLIMINNSPGGCGNDFALDDITIRERIIPAREAPATPKKTVVKKATPPPVTIKKQTKTREKTHAIPTINSPVIKQGRPIFPPPPPVLALRTNSLIKQLETEAGEIRLDLYDNGEIDGDTVSIYHNNVLLISHARLSQQPITFRIDVDAANPHHELVMVAENLGSIPPNTSVMVITTGNKRHQVFISSSTQKNAKVVLNLKE
jgi:hypothetical protein